MEIKELVKHKAYDRIFELAGRNRNNFYKLFHDNFEGFMSMNCGGSTVLNYIEAYRNIEYNSSILDVGCGNGAFLSFILSKGFAGKYIGFDSVKEYITAAKEVRQYENAEFFNGDMLTFDYSKVDVIIFNSVFSIQNDNASVTEIIKKVLPFFSDKIIITGLKLDSPTVEKYKPFSYFKKGNLVDHIEHDIPEAYIQSCQQYANHLFSLTIKKKESEKI